MVIYEHFSMFVYAYMFSVLFLVFVTNMILIFVTGALVIYNVYFTCVYIVIYFYNIVYAPLIAQNIYVDENALQPGSSHPTFNNVQSIFSMQQKFNKLKNKYGNH